MKWVNKEGETVAAADVPEDRYLFHATEESGVDIPIINKKKMCRQGCCTTCAVKVLEGKVNLSTRFWRHPTVEPYWLLIFCRLQFVVLDTREFYHPLLVSSQ